MVFDWIRLKIPGWNRRVRKIRREWDKYREKSLSRKRNVRNILLKKLDTIEERVRMIEEEHLPRFTRGRMAKEVEIDLEEIKIMLDTKDEEFLSEIEKKETHKE